ncbi:hypothetical protein PENTCL1PPCAC_25997, partial [Pristionchus entomophagus]
IISHRVKGNSKHIMNGIESIDSCLGCDGKKADGITCDDKSCGKCSCLRPLWCLDCISRLFKTDNQYLKAKCPNCRFKFCMDDIHPIVDENNVDI